MDERGRRRAPKHNACACQVVKAEILTTNTEQGLTAKNQNILLQTASNNKDIVYNRNKLSQNKN